MTGHPRKQRRSAAVRVAVRYIERVLYADNLWKLHLNCGHTKIEKAAEKPMRIAAFCEYCIDRQKRAW
jgi:hypothetical protein